MTQPLLAIGFPGPLEILILLVIFGVGAAFIFLLFRFLWRAGSKPQGGPPRREG